MGEPSFALGLCELADGGRSCKEVQEFRGSGASGKLLLCNFELKIS